MRDATHLTPEAPRAFRDREVTDDDVRLLLQSRLALVFTVLAGVPLFYALSHFAALLLSSTPPSAPLIVPVVTLAIGACNAGFALRCRKGTRSVAELRWLDAIAGAFPCWAASLLLTQVRPPVEASISLMLSVTYVLMARAVLLPSSGRRTFAVCLLALVPAACVGTWLRVQGLSGDVTPNDWLIQAYVVLRNFAITTFLATLTSNVIYGLRRQVQESARIGQYLLREKLGEGGMGVVYRATHALLRRDTAVKLLLPTRLSPGGLARFEREVTLTAQLTHPNTVAIFDYGRTPDGVFYYAMELLDGGDLETLVDYAGPLEPARVIWILEQICRALSEAHALGLVHRDVKPSNVLICERGQEGDVTKILDFGLVKDLNAAGPGVTRDESLTGTPLYLSPESITQPESVDARSDLYSLGALAYFLLVGEPPFAGKTIVEICAAHLHTTPQPPSQRRPGLSPELDAVILQCLEKQPSARPLDARALRELLLAATSAGAWNTRAATDWWREHRSAFRSFCEARRRAQLPATDLPHAATAPDSTLHIDLGRR